ncbi:GTPase IMAP family member 8-like [Alosa pseudoharengus]|uniref:GTPase IMAP family member 8-like n=1 Tax=Alosa pseudoharengus TaxID=34774 RepID=UPI003F8A948B
MCEKKEKGTEVIAEEEHHSQHELRVIVLGGKQSGKTSLINRVLRDFSPREIAVERRKGVVNDRSVVMVDTLGWWRNYKLIDTAKFITLKLQQSLSQCPPGPHAFVLTIRVDMIFDEENRRSVEEHMGLFGENIWEHTIVVFTNGESLEGKSIKQHTESEGEALKWVLEKCGNRYCVYDNKSSEDNQVTKLLGEIENVIKINIGGYFKLDDKYLLEVEKRARLVKEKANGRLKRRMEKREQLKEEAKIQSLPEIRMLLVGWISSRKTSAKNTILNREESVTRRTMAAEIQTGEVAGQKVSVVDTPSWWKYFPAHYTPGWVKTELRKSLSLGSKAPHAILIAVPADTTFLEEQRKITEDNMKMFGDHVWRHTMVLFTCGDRLRDMSIEEHIECEGEPLQWLIEKCGNRYHVFDNVNRGDGSQVTELLERIWEMIAGNSSYTDTQNTEVRETLEEPEGLGVEMGMLLDKEWNAMDKIMEEKIKELWTQLLGKGNQSMDAVVKFKENESSENQTNEKPPESPNTSAPGEGTSKSEAGDKTYLSEEDQHHLSRQTSEVHSELMEKIKETLNREFSRREIFFMERGSGIIQEMSTSHEAGDKKHLSGEDLHHLSRHTTEMHSDLQEKIKENLNREFSRRKTVFMERSSGIFQMSTFHDMTSEPDEQEFQQARKKVCRWLLRSSGFGSEVEDEDIRCLDV